MTTLYLLGAVFVSLFFAAVVAGDEQRVR